MDIRSLSRLSDAAITHGLAERIAAERAATAEALAYLVEYDRRQLFREKGYPSTFRYCVRELHLSEDEAYRRIRAARVARRFPQVLGLLAAGRLHLTAVVLLKPWLTQANAAELFAAATHKSKDEIQHLLAARFPQPDVPTRVVPLPSSPAPVTEMSRELVPEPVAFATTGPVALELAPESVSGEGTPERPGVPELTLQPVAAPSPPARVTPLAPERYAITVTVSKATHDRLRLAQDLLRRQIPDGSVADVLDRALELLVRDLEKRKFAVTERPKRQPAQASRNPRHIPNEVKRAVFKRDGGQCTFVGENGHRCEERGAALEYDHVIPIARGGTSTAGNLRLRCRAHNQLEAERVLGAEFMRHRRIVARDAAMVRANAPPG